MFASILELEEIDQGVFRAPRSPEDSDRMFGGQYLAQCIAAANQSLEEDRHIHSLHSYFLRPGNSSQQSTIRVETIRDGRSFSHRQASVFQNDKELFRMVASFSIQELAPDFQSNEIPEVPKPDDVSYTYYDFVQDQMPDEGYLRTVKRRPMDIRYINPPEDKKPLTSLPNQLMWIRVKGNLNDESWKHQAALAYISDSTLIDHICLPHGKRWMDSDFDGTSLDHVMWFHKSTDATDWILFEQIVEWTGVGRGLATGRLWSQSGELLATCGQEGLLRF